MKRLLSLAALVIAPLAITHTASASAACTWSPSSLPRLAGQNDAVVHATNHQGGYSGTAGNHIVSWQGGAITDLGTVNGGFVEMDQNRAGTILVNYSSGGPWNRTVNSFIIQNGQRTILTGGQPNTVHVSAKGINDAGDVVGTITVRQGTSYVLQAVRWPAGQSVSQPLPNVPAGADVSDLDEDGTVVLAIDGPSGLEWPHLWRNGTVTKLQGVPSATGGFGFSISNGRVSGHMYRGSLPNIGVYWDQSGVPHTLPQGNAAQLINRNGLIVGTSTGSGTHGVWRLGTLETLFGTLAQDFVDTNAIADDDTFAGSRSLAGHTDPTIWRCQ